MRMNHHKVFEKYCSLNATHNVGVTIDVLTPYRATESVACDSTCRHYLIFRYLCRFHGSRAPSLAIFAKLASLCAKASLSLVVCCTEPDQYIFCSCSDNKCRHEKKVSLPLTIVQTQRRVELHVT